MNLGIETINTMKTEFYSSFNRIRITPPILHCLNLASNDKSFKLASPYSEINFNFSQTQRRIA